jgi:hypothetical protein
MSAKTGIKTNLDEIFGNVFKKFEEQIIPALLEQIESICIEVVNEAKQLDTYKDQTGNLRSSIGYVIYNNGKKINEKFEQVEGGADGVKTGAQIADDAAKEYKQGIVAVIVAGMDYALAVESKGYDVLTGPTGNIFSMLLERLQDIKDVYK